MILPILLALNGKTKIEPKPQSEWANTNPHFGWPAKEDEPPVWIINEQGKAQLIKN